MSTTAKVLTISGLAVVAWWYYTKRQAAASVPKMNSLAHATTFVTNYSSAFLDQGGWVGHEISQSINAPLTNVTSGNATATVESALTGGLSDLTSWRPW